MSCKKSCIVPNCNSFNLPTYGFPRFGDQRSKWSIAVGLRPESVSTFARICVKHFKENDFIKLSKRLTLRSDAVPFVDEAEKSKDWFVNEKTTNTLRKKKKKTKTKELSPIKKTKLIKRSPALKKSEEKVKITKSTKFELSPSARQAVPLIEKIVETPDVQNTTVIDKDYYFVMINKHKKDMINERKNEPASSSISAEVFKETSKDLISFNDLLKEAIKVSSSVDNSTKTGEIFDGLKMPDCFNTDCRQLAGRVYLLQNQKDKLQKVYEELKSEVETMEWNYSQLESSSDLSKNVDDIEPPKQICSSCVDGRLNNLYTINVTRVNYLQRKLNEIKQENNILAKELHEIESNKAKKTLEENTKLERSTDKTDKGESETDDEQEEGEDLL